MRTAAAIYSFKPARSRHSCAFTHWPIYGSLILLLSRPLPVPTMWKYAIVAAMAVVAVYGFGDGAPPGACGDMVPRHPVSAQDTPAPYTITTSTKVVKAGTPMQVVITGKSAKDTIRGLLLQARRGDQPVGTFAVSPNDPFKLLDCGAPGNAVTHRKHDAKDDKQTVSFTWTPPADLNDIIKFRATIAYNGAVFWVGVESAPIKVTN